MSEDLIYTEVEAWNHT